MVLPLDERTGIGQFLSLEKLVPKEQKIHKNDSNESESPIVLFVNQILHEAHKNDVSDIHFEPYDKSYRIRYRQDGLLYEIAKPPLALSPQISARLKILSNLDIAEKRIPQDGGFKIKLEDNKTVDFRVSTCPTTAGEKIVVRVLNPNSAKLDIKTLGLSSFQQNHFMHSIKRQQGLILVTGPTGSGKTMTLYTALNYLNTADVNILTVEDPVEMKFEGVNQVSMNTKAGLSFANVLRSFLRQDPDIIMIGEIRDYETAEIAIKAAQTGHLVLSTLHTNSAAETIDRLVNMGIPRFNLVSSINLIVAQRLARKLCESCKLQREDLTEPNLLLLGFNKPDIQNMKFYKARGCELCNQGYRGRIGLFEILPVSQAIHQLILTGKSAIDIQKTAQDEGMLTIYQSGLEQIKLGLCSLEEVNRITID